MKSRRNFFEKKKTLIASRKHIKAENSCPLHHLRRWLIISVQPKGRPYKRRQTPQKKNPINTIYNGITTRSHQHPNKNHTRRVILFPRPLSARYASSRLTDVLFTRRGLIGRRGGETVLCFRIGVLEDQQVLAPGSAALNAATPARRRDALSISRIVTVLQHQWRQRELISRWWRGKTFLL